MQILTNPIQFDSDGTHKDMLDPSTFEEEEKEYMEQQLAEAQVKLEEMRVKDPERFAELQRMQAEWEATPEGQQAMRQAEAAEALEREAQMGVQGKIDGTGQFGL